MDKYSLIFHGRDDLLDKIPPIFRKEMFSRLVNKGQLEVPLFRRIVDNRTDILDLKSASPIDDEESCRIIKMFPNLRTLYLTEVYAPSEGKE